MGRGRRRGCGGGERVLWLQVLEPGQAFRALYKGGVLGASASVQDSCVDLGAQCK